MRKRVAIGSLAVMLLVAGGVVVLSPPGPAPPQRSGAERRSANPRSGAAAETERATLSNDCATAAARGGNGTEFGKLVFRVVSGDRGDGVPVEEASVTIYPAEGNLEARTERARGRSDRDGLVTFSGLPPRTRFQALARAEGYGRGWEMWASASREARPHTIRLEEFRAFSGIVRDAVTGLPVEGARVVARDQTGVFMDNQTEIAPSPPISDAVTGPDGSFALPDSGGLLHVSAPGYATARKSLRGRSPVTIRLAPGAALTGRVAELDGTPARGVEVLACPACASTLHQYEPTTWRMREGLRWRSTNPGGDHEDLFAAEVAIPDAAGAWRIDGLAAGEEVLVTVVSASKPRTFPRIVRMPGPGGTLELDLRLPRLATLEIRLVLQDGRTVPAFRVEMSPVKGPGQSRRERCESGGRVEVPDVLPGTWKTKIVAPGTSYQCFELTLGEGEEVRRTIVAKPYCERPPGEPVTIRVDVVDDAGRPVSGASVSCDGADPRMRTTNAEGRAEFEKRLEEYPGLSASAPGHKDGGAGGWELNETGRARIVLRRRLTLHVPLAPPSGAPALASVEVSVRSGTSTSWRDMAVRDGVLTLELAAGVEEVRVSAPGYLPLRIDSFPPPGTETTSSPIALDPGASLTFEVRNGKGKPVAGAQVSVSSLQTGRTDAKGKVTISGLPLGDGLHASVRAEGYDQRDLAGLTPDRRDPIRVRLEEVRRVDLEGRLLYEDGLPAGMVRVVVHALREGGEESPETSVYADAAGRFRMTLEPGDYRVDLTPPRYEMGESDRRWFTVSPSPDEPRTVEFTLPRPR
jgi:hypothetical protein